jgi:hypothetical protein
MLVTTRSMSGSGGVRRAEEDINPVSKRSKGSNGNISGLANGEVGNTKMNFRLRSVLTHPLCLPLFYVMHDIKHDDENNANLPFRELLVENATLVPGVTKLLFDHVLLNALHTNQIWNLFKRGLPRIPKEVTITQRIVKHCNELNESGTISFFAKGEVFVANKEENARGRTDIVFTDTVIGEIKITPLMVIEVGLNGSQWWKKFDQCIRYLDVMSDPIERQVVVFTRPLLMSVITIDNGVSVNDVFVTKIAVFFCHPPRRDDNILLHRVTLLWHSVSKSRDEALINFGKVLEVTAHFQRWVNDTTDYANKFDYEYFSSNCCRLGDRVRN